MRPPFYSLLFLFLTISVNNIAAQCDVTVDAGEDQFACELGETVTLNGDITGSSLGFTWTPIAGLDDPMSLTPNATVTGPMTYTLTGFAEDPNAPNLVENPAFEDGNVGFFSSFAYNPLPITPGTYFLTTSPSVVLSTFPPCDDHTFGNGTGNLMLVNGTANIADVWCQTITVNPNTYYSMSAWVTSAPLGPPILQFSMNGILVGDGFQTSGAGCDWEQFSSSWFSGPNTSTTFCITDQSSGGNGLFSDFFALDDIYMGEACSESDEVMVDLIEIEAILPPLVELPCNALPDGIQLDGSASSSGPNITYQWTTSGGNIVSGENTLMPTVDKEGVYTLTVTFENGAALCEETAIIEVIPDPNQVMAFATVPDIINCINNTVTIDGSGSSEGPTISYEWTPLTGILSGETTQYPEVSIGGTYTLVVTNSISGCTDMIEVEVEEDTTQPTAMANTPGELNCLDTILTLNGLGSSTGSPGFSYEWVAGNGGHIVSGENTLNNCVVDSAGDYQLTVTNNNNGCIDIAVTTVDANIVLPKAVAETMDSVDCLNTLALVTGDSSETGSQIGYIWTTTNGNIVSDTLLVNVEVDQGGTYILTVKDSVTGCEARDTTIVFENTNIPMAVANAAKQFTCLTDSLQLDGTGSSADSVYTYNWTTTDGVIASGNNTLFPYVNASGNYYLTVLDTTNGCVALDTATVFSNTQPPISEAGAPAAIGCDGGPQMLDGNGSSTGADYTHLWTTDVGNILSGETSLTPEVNALGTYFITTTNELNGCTSMDSVIVTADGNAPTVVAIVSDTLDCNNMQLTIDGSSSSSGTSILWETVDGHFVSGETTLTPIVDEGGTYILTLTNASNNCSGTTSVTVVQDTLSPQTSIAPSDMLNCFQYTDTLDATLSSQGTNFSPNWTHSPPSGGVGGGIVTGEMTSSPIVDAAGVYILTLTNNDNGCVSTDSVTVEANFDLPTTEAGDEQTIDCTNSTITLDGTGSSQGNEFDYQWTYTPPVGGGGGGIISGETTDMPMVNAAGVYVLTITNNVNGCLSTDSVTVQPDFNTPTADAGATDTISCVDTQTTLDGMGSSQGNEFNYQWTYTPPAGGAGGGIISGENSLSPIVGAAGIYVLTVENTDNGCISVDSVLVEQETVFADADANSINVTCNGLANGQASVTPPGGTAPYSYEWSNGDTTATIENLPPGTYDVTVYDANNCPSSGQVTIEQPPALTIEPVAVNPAGCGGGDNGSATVAADGGTPDFTYLWSNDDTGPSVGNLAAGTYTVTATDANDCMVSLEVEIITDNTIDLEMPTVMTQNITVELDANGTATISAMDIDNGSFDNCGIESMSLDATDFNCDHIGENTVTLTAMDASGNDNSTTAIVTVVDNAPPVVNGCPDNMVLPFCEPVAEFDITATDNCSTDVTTTQTSGLPSGSSFPLGETTEQFFEMTDASGNTANCSFEITVVDAMSVTPSVADVSCFGEADGSIDVTATGGSPDYTYLWSNGDTTSSILELTPGVYTLSITDDMGCESVQEYEVLEPEQLITSLVNIINETGSNQDGEVDVTVTGGEMPYTYQWTDINGNPIGDMEDISGLSAGTYQLFVTDANGCVSSSAYTIQNMTSTNNPELDALINIFPNPTSGWLTVELTDLPFVEMDVTVHDVIGQAVFSQPTANVAAGKYFLDFTDFAEGLYLMELNFDGERVTKRVVKVGR